MKHPFSMVVLTFCVFSQYTFSQETVENPEKYTAHNKGKFYIFWGGNRESFSKSDIHFKGADYDFTLHNVEAHDKPKGFHLDYFNPSRMTIPQTNIRIGYFISDHYNISIGLDHMKYVMYNDKRVNYSGYYPNAGTYGENPIGDELTLKEDFLLFEHTDGLNYINTEISRVDDISSIFKITNTDKFQINLTEGIGGGFLYPKTNATLLGKERHDDFNVAGFGLGAKVGLNFTFFKYFFIQTELKGGYIEMNNIKTTNDSADSAQQNFWFLQRILTIGGIFRI
ncbi:putative outermembrane protein [Flavobacteria bacterium BAL38]|nr:putative outermembrane protein [Flavobacteria bacterium BAL38]